jgi:hypothetical protein
MEALFQNVIQNMYIVVTLSLFHVKTGRMILLERIVFHINKYEKQPVFNRRKRTVSVDGKTSTAVAIPAVHVIMCKIILICLRKTGKQLAEFLPGKTGQGTETFSLF